MITDNPFFVTKADTAYCDISHKGNLARFQYRTRLTTPQKTNIDLAFTKIEVVDGIRVATKDNYVQGYVSLIRTGIVGMQMWDSDKKDWGPMLNMSDSDKDNLDGDVTDLLANKLWPLIKSGEDAPLFVNEQESASLDN